MQHLKRLIVVFTLGLFFILLSSWPVALAAAPQASNLFVVPYPAGLLPACTQSDPCRLQEAMNKAVTSDRLYLAAGIYTGTLEAVLVVTKSVVSRWTTVQRLTTADDSPPGAWNIQEFSSQAWGDCRPSRACDDLERPNR